MEKWVVFYNSKTNETLSELAITGYFPAEIRDIKESLAYKHGIVPSIIEIRLKFE